MGKRRWELELLNKESNKSSNSKKKNWATGTNKTSGGGRDLSWSNRRSTIIIIAQSKGKGDLVLCRVLQ